MVTIFKQPVKSRVLSFFICLALLLSVCNLYALSATALGESVVPCVSMGSTFALALNSRGGLYIWGTGSMLGAAAADSDTPIPLSVPGVTFVAISAGEDHALALSSVGEVYAWGADNGYGELGNALDVPVYIPTKVSLPAGTPKVVAVSAGDNYSLALTADGSIYAWGTNDKGQLGVNFSEEEGQIEPLSSGTPIRIPGVSATQIYASSKGAVAIDHDGGFWMWGSDGGTGLIAKGADPHLPVKRMPGDHFATCVLLGNKHASFVTLDREVYSWGLNDKGQFGNGEIKNTATSQYKKAEILSDESVPLRVEQIAGGMQHTVALTEEGQVYTWGGTNNCGELGYEHSESPTHTPRRVEIPTESGDRIIHIDARMNRSVALDSSGYVWIWGSDWGNSNTKYAAPTVVRTENGSRFSLGAAPMISVYSTSVTANVTVPTPVYTASIPATLDLGELRQRSEGDATRYYTKDFSVTVTDVDHLFGEKQIKVSVSDESGSFLLSDGDYTLPFAVYPGASGGTAVTAGGTLAAFTGNGSAVGRIEIDQSMITRKGNYTGSLIFTFAVEPLSADE